MAFDTAFERIFLHDDQSLWHCPENYFLETPDGGLCMGLCYPDWDTSLTADGTVTLGYTLGCRAEGHLSLEPTFYGTVEAAPAGEIVGYAAEFRPPVAFADFIRAAAARGMYIGSLSMPNIAYAEGADWLSTDENGHPHEYNACVTDFEIRIREIPSRGGEKYRKISPRKFKKTLDK